MSAIILCTTLKQSLVRFDAAIAAAMSVVVEQLHNQFAVSGAARRRRRSMVLHCEMAGGRCIFRYITHALITWKLSQASRNCEPGLPT